MKFTELNRLRGVNTLTEVSFDSLADAIEYTEVLFNSHELLAFEQTEYANCTHQLSLKDKSNKIIYLLKQNYE